MRRTLIRNMVTGEWREPGQRYNPEAAPTEAEWRKIYLLDLTPRGTHLPCGSYHENWGASIVMGKQEEWYALFT